jgi:PAS domain S-box-containing protein
MEEKLFYFFLFLRRKYLRQLADALASDPSSGKAFGYDTDLLLQLIQAFFDKEDSRLQLPSGDTELFLGELKKTIAGHIPLYTTDVQMATEIYVQLDTYANELNALRHLHSTHPEYQAHSYPEYGPFDKYASHDRLDLPAEEQEESLELRKALETAAEGISRTGPDEKLRKVSPEFAAMHGYTSREMKGKKWTDFIYPEDRSRVTELCRNLREKQKITFDARTVFGNGTYQHHEITLVPVWTGGEYTGHYAFHRDITEHRGKEDDLLSRNIQLESALKLAHMGTWEMDCGKKILSFSSGFREIYGMPDEESSVPLEDLLEYIPKEDRAMFRDRLQRCIFKKQPFNIYHPIRRADGTERMLHTIGEVVEDKRKNTLRVLGIGQDITEGLNQEKKFQTLLECAPDAILIFNEKLTIQEWNKKAEEIFGWTRFEVLGKKLDHLLIPEKYREKFRNNLQRLLSSGGKEGFYRETELLAMKKYGASFPIETSVSSVKLGKGYLFLVFLRDITRRKATDQLLKQRAEELQKSNTELERFVHVASHDLQEPLRSISSYVQLLQLRYGNKLDKNAGDYIRYAVEGAGRMHMIINDLLTYARTSSAENTKGETDCSRVLRNVLNSLRQQISASSAEITFSPALEKLPILMAEENQMVELFQHLLSNALKFSTGGVPPRIYITVHAYDTDTTADKELIQQETAGTRLSSADLPSRGWLFEISDNGIGIPKEYCEKIFVIFQRLHARNRYPGTGIGLAICKKIVERHSGRIWVKSEPGRGSSFKFVLPKIPRSTLINSV